MAVPTIEPTGRELFFDEDELIVSKTDAKGIITYVNKVFLKVAGYEENEVLGQPHNCIRHPDMPRSVFQLLWDTISAGDEIFAYVINQAKNGDHYWVLAHVTPTFDGEGQIIGYHSNRRVPDRSALDKVIPVYRALCEVEAAHSWRALRARLRFVDSSGGFHPPRNLSAGRTSAQGAVGPRGGAVEARTSEASRRPPTRQARSSATVTGASTMEADSRKRGLRSSARSECGRPSVSVG